MAVFLGPVREVSTKDRAEIVDIVGEELSQFKSDRR